MPATLRVVELEFSGVLRHADVIKFSNLEVLILSARSLDRQNAQALLVDVSRPPP